MTNKELDLQARKAAQQYQGGFALFTALLGLAIFAGYLATPFAVVSGVVPLWLGSLLMVLLTYMSYTVLHEAVHGSISGSHTSLRWINEWLGYGAAFILMIPLTAHRHEHLAHHRNTNNSAEDPDFVVSKLTRSPAHAASTALHVYLSQFRYYLRHRWNGKNTKQNYQVVAEVAVAFGARAAFLAQGFWLEGITLMLVGGIGGIAVTMYLFAYIVHRPHETEGRYTDTSTIIGPDWCNGILTWCWLFQNYHSIHHLFPRIPFYHYRRLFDEIEPAMRAHHAPIYKLTTSGLKTSGENKAGQGKAITT